MLPGLFASEIIHTSYKSTVGSLHSAASGAQEVHALCTQTWNGHKDFHVTLCTWGCWQTSRQSCDFGLRNSRPHPPNHVTWRACLPFLGITFLKPCCVTRLLVQGTPAAGKWEAPCSPAAPPSSRRLLETHKKVGVQVGLPTAQVFLKVQGAMNPISGRFSLIPGSECPRPLKSMHLAGSPGLHACLLSWVPWALHT